MSNTQRKYCWRVGSVLEIPNGEPCPECGNPCHELYKQNDCGAYVDSGNYWKNDGGHCRLERGHAGKHAAIILDLERESVG